MRAFLAGAPWARRFFDPKGIGSGRNGRPSIRDSGQLSIQSSINQYIDTLLQWLYQISSNIGSGFRQELFTAAALATTDEWVNDLGKVVQGKARPRLTESNDTVEAIKYKIDCLPDNEIAHAGVAGLADCLWELVL